MFWRTLTDDELKKRHCSITVKYRNISFIPPTLPATCEQFYSPSNLLVFQMLWTTETFKLSINHDS